MFWDVDGSALSFKELWTDWLDNDFVLLGNFKHSLVVKIFTYLLHNTLDIMTISGDGIFFSICLWVDAQLRIWYVAQSIHCIPNQDLCWILVCGVCVLSYKELAFLVKFSQIWLGWWFPNLVVVVLVVENNYCSREWLELEPRDQYWFWEWAVLREIASHLVVFVL